MKNNRAGKKRVNGPVYTMPVKAPQIESVCFKDANTLWLLDEITASLYEVPVSTRVKIK